jgi:hypothetical protein
MQNLKLTAGFILFMVWVLAFLVRPAYAAPVTVYFERDLPHANVKFQRTFEDIDAFEMWLADRIDRKGCDPYLKKMVIEFD